MPLTKTSAPFGRLGSWIADKVLRRKGLVAGKAAKDAAHAVSDATPTAAKTVAKTAPEAVQAAETVGKEVAENTKKPGFFAHVTKPVRDKVHAAGSWAFHKLPEGAQKKLTAANDWRVKNKLNFGTAGDALNAGLMAYFAGNDLANGESIGSVAGNLAGFYAGSRAIRRFLPKGDSFGAGVGRFVGDMGAGIAGSIGLQYLGDKYMPIGRLAKPVEESYGTAPMEMPKEAEENSMNKTAMIKEAEVAGVLAAFTDAGLMQKFAEEDFDYLTEKVAENLPGSFTVDDVAYVADALLSGGVEKTAEEAFIEETAPVFGYALMAKLAGEMDDDDLDDFIAGYFEGAGF